MTDMAPHDFWQQVHPPRSFPKDGGFTSFYVAELEDGRQLRLPIRPLAGGEQALASLIVNQASFEVVDTLAEGLAEKIRRFDIDVVAGLPTLGLTLASTVAQKLGHGRYAPLGTSRKFWLSRRPLRRPFFHHHANTTETSLYRSAHAALA
jgi:adenine/guanine phosphoribosyltransferase-like PRPP-binding protein